MKLSLVAACLFLSEMLYAQSKESQLPSVKNAEIEKVFSKVNTKTYPKGFIYTPDRPTKVVYFNDIQDVFLVENYLDTINPKLESNVGDVTYFGSEDLMDTIPILALKDFIQTLILNKKSNKLILNPMLKHIIFYYYDDRFSYILGANKDHLELLTKNESNKVLLVLIYPNQKTEIR